MFLNLKQILTSVTTHSVRLARALWGMILDVWENEERLWEDIIATVDAAFANNYSLLFDGTNDYVSIAGGAVNLGTTNTIALWAKWTGAGSMQHHPLAASAWGGGGYHLYPVAGALMVIRVDDGTLVWNEARTVTHMTNAGNCAWQHWAISRDDDDVIFYINGAAMGAAKTLSSTQGDTLVDLIGTGWSSGASYNEWEGHVDEVALFDAVLDASAIDAIYNSGVPTDLSSEGNLVAYWRLEEGTGTSTADSSANSNTGTLINGAAWSSTVPE